MRMVMRHARKLLLHGFVIAVALGTLAASNADWPQKPGTLGYRMPWNRPTQDSVVDLLPGEFIDRFEFRGRLLDERNRPLPGLLVYVYHADRAGMYGSKQYPTINTMAGCVRTGPGGGFVVRTLVPGQYEGPPHMHFEVPIPDRGRCAWFVNFRPDAETRVLPNSYNRGPGYAEEIDEHFALVHLDRDGVYRTSWRVLHTQRWSVATVLDSVHAEMARKYELAPWRGPKPSPH